MRSIRPMIFDLMYRFPITFWSDSRVPPEVAQLAADMGKTGKALDVGCGMGTFAIYLAQQGFAVTGVDFSPTAIRKARARASRAAVTAEFIVHDVTRLDILSNPFDVALDVGCFHCMRAPDQQRYASELTRLMRPGSTLLMWGMDSPPPGGLPHLSAALVEQTFTPGFKLNRVESSQRRGAPSHWYWLVRQ